MQKIAFFGPQRKIIKFEIEDRRITYFDDNWKEGIIIMPLDNPKVKLEVKKMILSRKKGISAMGLLIGDANHGKNKEEYESCKTEEDIIKLITKDCKARGLVEA